MVIHPGHCTTHHTEDLRCVALELGLDPGTNLDPGFLLSHCPGMAQINLEKPYKMRADQFDSITAWQKQTFGQATVTSKIRHLLQEIKELTTAETDEEIRMEFADCFILLFGAASSFGLTYDEICSIIEEKHQINLRRSWGTPGPDGVVNHIKKP